MINRETAEEADRRKLLETGVLKPEDITVRQKDRSSWGPWEPNQVFYAIKRQASANPNGENPRVLYQRAFKYFSSIPPLSQTTNLEPNERKHRVGIAGFLRQIKDALPL